MKTYRSFLATGSVLATIAFSQSAAPDAKNQEEVRGYVLCPAGKLLGMQVVPQALYDAGYVNNGLMVLAPGAFCLLGIIVWIQRSISGYVEK